MKWFDNLLVWVLLGAILSGVQLLFTPWMMPLLPAGAVAHTVLVSTLCLVVALPVVFLPDSTRVYTLGAAAVVLSGYFLGWFRFYSRLADLSAGFSWGASLVLVVLLAVVIARAYWWFCWKLQFRWPVTLGLLTVVVVLKAGILAYLPAETLMTRQPIRSSVDAALNPDEVSVWDFAYPFSDFMTVGVNRFGWLLPSNPTDDRIFFLLLDGFRGDYLGKDFYGRSVTPNLDRLASRGLSFPQYRVQSSWTKPSTASLFTGLYPNDHGTIYGGGDRGGYEGHVLPGEFETLGERLKSQGYSNFGSVMSGHISSRYNYDQGFDVWLSPGKGFGTDFLVLEKALFWNLKEQPDKSFTYLHVKGPHQPFSMAYHNWEFWKRTPYLKDGKMDADSRFSFRSTEIVDPLTNGKVELRPSEVTFLRNLYAAQVNLYDRKFVAPFLERLKQLGLYESSLVVVTGDHGEELYDHGSYAHGQTLYEETIHTPLVMKFPRDQQLEKPPENLLVESIDLSSTLVNFAGASREGMTGESFLPVITSGETPPESFREAYAQNAEKDYLKNSTVVRWPWKLIHDYTTGENELYHLVNDPGETNPVDGKEDLKTDLRERIFATVGSDSVPDGPSVSFREATEAELRNLEGLGYLE